MLLSVGKTARCVMHRRLFVRFSYMHSTENFIICDMLHNVFDGVEKSNR